MIQSIYLDNNASTPLDPKVADYLAQIVPSLQGNPSSTHRFGRVAKGFIAEARAKIAAYLQVEPSELIFTSGGTESVNLAIRGILGNTLPAHIITSGIEHACVLACCKQLEKLGCRVTYLPTGPFGAVSLEAIERAILPETRLIALMAVNNETGVKTDIEAIADLARARQIPFFVDGVAFLGKEEFSIPKGVSVMAFSGHKIHALQGIGLLFVRSLVKLQPLLIGGDQEFGKRAGTENVLGILSMSKAIEQMSASDMAYVQKLRVAFETALLNEISTVCINGEGPRTSNVSNLAFLGVDGESLLVHLDSAGIAASHGSACSSGALEPSKVLLGMGLPLERVHSSIRFSFSRFNTFEEVESVCSVLVRLVKRLRTCSESSIG